MTTLSVLFWVKWAFLLLAQNFSFTFVSRARNSGSLKRHMMASLLSNGVWFVSQMFIFSAMMDILSGKAGTLLAIGAAAFYILFTMSGALIGHYISLRTEKGKGSVGANKKYAQIKVEDWEAAQYLLHRFRSRKTCDELMDMLVEHRQGNAEVVREIPKFSFPNRRTGPTKETIFS